MFLLINFCSFLLCTSRQNSIPIECTSLPIIWCDNVSATKLAKNVVYHSRTKHIELDMHFIRDKVLAKELEINYIPSEEQIADILTKLLTFIHFNHFRAKLNVHPCLLNLRGAVKEAYNAYKRVAHSACVSQESVKKASYGICQLIICVHCILFQLLSLLHFVFIVISWSINTSVVVIL